MLSITLLHLSRGLVSPATKSEFTLNRSVSHNPAYLLLAGPPLDSILSLSPPVTLYRLWLILEALARRPGTQQRLLSAFCIALFFGAFFLDLEFPRPTFLHKPPPRKQGHETALAGMGYLWGRGSRPMSELVIAHVSATCHPELLRLFLRSLKHGPAQDHADVVLLMSADPSLGRVVLEEEGVYQRVKGGLAEAWLKETEAARAEAVKARALLQDNMTEGNGERRNLAEGDGLPTGGRLVGEEKTPDLDPESKSGAKLNELANTADTGSTATVDEASIQRAAQTGSSLKDGASIR